MTAPAVVSSTNGGDISGAASHAVTIPACAIGDLIVIVAAIDNHTSGGPTDVEDFGRLFNASEGDGVVYGGLYERVVDGSEAWYNGGAGGSATMTHAAAAVCGWQAVRITGADAIEFAYARSTLSTLADPPNLTPAALATDRLWLAAAVWQNAPTWDSDPGGYTHIGAIDVGGTLGGVTTSIGYRIGTGASENPSSFTSHGPGGEHPPWIAFTIAAGISTVVVPPAEPPFVPPLPGNAVVEIYASQAGAARWGLAHWGEDVWSTAAWQDVTPESVDVEIIWGGQRPELGILDKPVAGSWAVDLYDPDRTLDPANVESPYYGNLLPGLPVRVRHLERVVRQGIAESIAYQFSEEFGTKGQAIIRVTDVISTMANADVPSDSTLSDTLFARARDAIAAAGLTVTVLGDPPAGDPALAPWGTGTERTVWEWISDAAESVLWVPYVTNVGHLGFREYAAPLDRARRIGSPNLVGLTSIVQHNGLYSIVQARQTVADGGAIETRELTPKPRYGARTFLRDDATPDAGDWAFAVLNDRANAGLRWVPGAIYPLTAADVAYFAELEAVERVGLYYPEADPAVIQDVIILGGRITVTGKRGSEAIWSFEFEAAQTAQSPLIDDDDGSTFLVRDDDPTEYLYPDG